MYPQRINLITVEGVSIRNHYAAEETKNGECRQLLTRQNLIAELSSRSITFAEPGTNDELSVAADAKSVLFL